LGRSGIKGKRRSITIAAQIARAVPVPSDWTLTAEADAGGAAVGERRALAVESAVGAGRPIEGSADALQVTPSA
jgi:hypothetical protein